LPRLLSIDYGRKRVGIAVSDPMQIIATGLETVHSKDIFSFLKEYCAKEEVETIIVGYPVTLQNKASEALKFVNPFIKKLIKEFPTKKVVTHDERFTSKMAFQTLIDAGAKQKTRRKKELTDKISAVIILQDYMETISNIK